MDVPVPSPAGNKPVYLDNASTTFEHPAVSSIMWRHSRCANPMNVLHRAGREAAGAVDEARAKVARLINAKPSEIYFTSGATEANNWVIRALCDHEATRGKRRDFLCVASLGEHHSVLFPLYPYSTPPRMRMCAFHPEPTGEVSPERFRGILRMYPATRADVTKTPLVSAMLVNNETGALSDIKAIAAIAHDQDALFHTDATQAVGKMPVDVKDLGVDFLSMSAHKFHGPKGVGALYIREGVEIPGWMRGGGQEFEMRAGTHNVPGIAGMGVAAERAAECRPADLKPFIARVLSGIPDAIAHAAATRVPYIASMSFPGIDGEAAARCLDDLFMVQAGTGAACASLGEPSPVLRAMGVDDATARATLRFSSSHENTPEDLEYAAYAVIQTVQRLRSLSKSG